MTKFRFECRNLLGPEGWRCDESLVVTPAGVIMDDASDEDKLPAEQLDLVIPGMPNLHSHAFQRAMAGLAGERSGSQDSFWTWREQMYRLAQAITPQQLHDVAAWLQVEMLKAGFTSCAEFHYLHHQPGGTPYDALETMSQQLFNAAGQSGIGLSLLPVFYAASGFGSAQVEAQQLRFSCDADTFVSLVQACQRAADEVEFARVGIAPHSLRAAPPHAMKEVVDALAAQVCAIHIHIAEQPAEVADCLRHTGQRPVEWLLEHFDVDEQWCLVHATHMEPFEVQASAASGAVAGLCPITEADLGDGLFSLQSWLDAGGAFGVGSDSNLRLDAAGELRLLEFGARLASGQRNVMARTGRSCGGFAWQEAARGGALALGQPVGSLTPGKRADFVELDSSHPLLAGLEPELALNAFVFAGEQDMIRSVWVGGKKCVDRGRHPHEDRLYPAFSKAMSALRSP